jgi:hypothetical protein
MHSWCCCHVTFSGKIHCYTKWLDDDKSWQKKSGNHDLTNIIACASSVSFIMRNVLVGFENPGIWPFVRNAYIDEQFYSGTCCMRWRYWILRSNSTVSGLANIASAAPCLSRSGGRLEGKIKNSNTFTREITYWGYWWQEKTTWNSQFQI